jgi:hypothetical protein
LAAPGDGAPRARDKATGDVLSREPHGRAGLRREVTSFNLGQEKHPAKEKHDRRDARTAHLSFFGGG